MQTELRVSFTVPEVTGDYYQVGLCNDPCTVAGFGETVSGSVSIIATAREGRLLSQNGKLHARAAGLERDLRKAEKAAKEHAVVTSSTLAESEAEGQALHSQVRSLEADLTAAQDTAARAEGRIPLDPWAAAAIAVAIVAVTWMIARRGRAASPDGSDAVPEHA
jgi:outer membrane murein-binding lipoprotein Lpp